ncbi:MAG TPA: phosphotransferase family protein [Myxococcota bacterium]|nr:phosphotransferase family protein [Myxococcota bacterium]
MTSRASLAPEWQRAFAWVEACVGGKIARFERQPRWRPAWNFDVECGGEMLPLHFRGARIERGVYPLEREAHILQLLESEGVPVPHVHGFCRDPEGILMDRVRGRANLATEASAALRESAQRHYIELLAQMHAIPLARCEAIGMERPANADALARADLDFYLRPFREGKQRPEPLIELALRWLARRAPRDRSEVAFLTGDAGQFLFEKGRVTAVLDLELALLGDPLADLGALRSRDLSEPLGDLSAAVRHYESLRGPADRAVIDYHTARFALCTPLAVANLIARPPKWLDLVQYTAWYHVYGRAALEAIAMCDGIPLERPALPPSERPIAIGTADFDSYARDAADRVAVWRERQTRYGAALEADTLAEFARILGSQPRTLADADAALESLALANGDPAREAEMLRALYRRCLREEALLQPVLRELEGVAIQRIA